MTNRDEWLAQRSTAIGASESPSLFGVGFTTPYVLWARKCGLLPPDDETEPMEVGTLMQPVIAELLRRRTGWNVAEVYNEFRRMDGKPHIGCSPDCYVNDPARGDALGLAELKNVGLYMAKEWTEEPPLHVSIQMQHQMAVTGLTWGAAVGLVGGTKIKWHVVERNEEFIALLVRKCDEFWRLVETGEAPPVDGESVTTEAIKALHPADNGETAYLPDSFVEVAEELESLNRIIKDTEARREELANLVRSTMGDCTYAVLPDGSGWSWKSQTRKAYEVKESTSRVLRKIKGIK